jgi:hypothetical protein
MDLSVVALVVAGVTLVWQVGEFVSKKTKNTVDDFIFQHPEVKDAIVKLIEQLLAKRGK